MKKTTNLSEKEVKHVAKLAKLSLAPQEVKKFQKQLSEVLSYVAILEEVETKKIEPTSQVTSLENVFSEDKPEKSISQKQALSGSKKTFQGCFKIKRILNNN